MTGSLPKYVKEMARVACAQGSMVAILPELGETAIPVLTSPIMGVANAVDQLQKIMTQRG